MRRWMALACVCAGCSPLVTDEGEGGADTGATSTSPSTTSPSTTSPTTTATTAADTATAADGAEVDVDDGSFDTGEKLDFGGVVDTGECEYYWASQQCALVDEPNAFGSAITPLGEIGVSYAYFVSQTGCGGCVDANVAAIYLLPAPAFELGSGPPDNSIVLDIAFGDGFYGPFGEPQEAAGIYAYLAGDGADTNGATFVLDGLPGNEQLAEPFDPNDAAIIGGTIDLEADGWSVHVSFDARYCPEANYFYICE